MTVPPLRRGVNIARRIDFLKKPMARHDRHLFDRPAPSACCPHRHMRRCWR
jgi:hypothetical protein